MRRKIKLGRLSDEAWSKRSGELRPILAELSALNDNAAATALNARGVPALGGGKWKNSQVTRVRQRLELDTEQAAHIARYRALRANLIKHFGEPSPPRDDHIAEAAVWAGYVVDRYNQVHRRRANLIRFNRAHGRPLDYAGDGQPPIAALPADVWRQYKRDLALLTVAIELCQIASDAFAIAAQKSLLWEILQTGTGIAAEIELAQKPAIVADSATAGSA